MPLILPICGIAGQKPLKMFETADGGMDMMVVWDVDAGEFVRGGTNELDVIMGREAPGGEPCSAPRAVH